MPVVPCQCALMDAQALLTSDSPTTHRFAVVSQAAAGSPLRFVGTGETELSAWADARGWFDRALQRANEREVNLLVAMQTHLDVWTADQVLERTGTSLEAWRLTLHRDPSGPVIPRPRSQQEVQIAGNANTSLWEGWRDVSFWIGLALTMIAVLASNVAVLFESHHRQDAPTVVGWFVGTTFAMALVYFLVWEFLAKQFGVTGVVGVIVMLLVVLWIRGPLLGGLDRRMLELEDAPRFQPAALPTFEADFKWIEEQPPPMAPGG